MLVNELTEFSPEEVIEDLLEMNVDYDKLYVEFCELGLLPTPLLHLSEDSDFLTSTFFDYYYDELIMFIDVVIATEISEEYNLEKMSSDEIMELHDKYREYYYMESEELFVETLFDLWRSKGYVLSDYSSEKRIINKPFQPVW